MSTKRGATSEGTRRAASGTIDALEEKVVRMRRGLAAPDDLELGRVGQHNPVTRAKLQEIEARALVLSGRLDALRADVGLPGLEANAGAKEKIVGKLGEAAPRARVAAKAQAKPGARVAKPTASARPAPASRVTAKAVEAKAKAKAPVKAPAKAKASARPEAATAPARSRARTVASKKR